METSAFGKTEKKSVPEAAPRHFNQQQQPSGGGLPVADGGAKKTQDIIQVRFDSKLSGLARIFGTVSKFWEMFTEVYVLGKVVAFDYVLE